MQTVSETLDDFNGRVCDVHRRLFDEELQPEEHAEDRYAFDFALMPTRRWAQIDTADDASHYGMWTCPAERRIICFADGDITDTRCASDPEYLAQVYPVDRPFCRFWPYFGIFMSVSC